MSDLFSYFGYQFQFRNPWFLLAFVLFIPLLVRDLQKRKIKGIKVPSISGMKGTDSLNLAFSFLKLTKYLILSCLIIAFARPQSFMVDENRNENKGIDIMLAVDISYSMLAQDLQPDRLTALEKIAQQFVQDRPNDRIGLVAYAGEGFLKVPLTTDHEAVMDQLRQLNPNELAGGTAIGDGLAIAVNHIKDSKAKSKIIILMTDGVQTIDTSLNPVTAAKIAADNHVKVYTIGIGSNGMAPMPTYRDFFGNIVFTDQKVEIDEAVLQQIAKITGGEYFRATSTEKLQDIYDQINQMEKSDVKAHISYNYIEYFRPFLWAALIILLIDALFRWVIFKILM